MIMIVMIYVTRIVQHQFIDATCEEPKTCTACGKQEGQALGHLWVDATFEEAKTCSRCGKIEGADYVAECHATGKEIDYDNYDWDK